MAEYLKKVDLLSAAVEVEYLGRPRMMVSVAKIGQMPSIEAVPMEYHNKVCEEMARRHQAEIAELTADRPQGEWIPCSERLPSEKGMYLVTSREKATAEEFGFDLDDVEVKKMRFDEDGWRIPKHIPEWINGVVHTTVLAWMPLPKPWKGADDE